jgi:hypothetical protein
LLTPPDAYAAFLKEMASRVDAPLQATVADLAKDAPLATVLRALFAAGGGIRLARGDTGWNAQYRPGPPPGVTVNPVFFKVRPDELRWTLPHELVHFLLDLADARAWELPSPEGLDHALIDAVVRRTEVIESLRAGIGPLRPLISLSRPSDVDARLRDQIRAALDANDTGFLEGLVATDALPSIGVARVEREMTSLGRGYWRSRAWPQRRGALNAALRWIGLGAPPPYTPAQRADLGALGAQSGAIARHGLAVALEMSERSGRKVKETFADPVYRERMGRFLVTFFDALERNPRQDVGAAERSLRSR